MGIAQRINDIIQGNPGVDYSNWKFAPAWNHGLASDTIEAFYRCCKEIINDARIARMCDTALPLVYDKTRARSPEDPPSAGRRCDAEQLLNRDHRLSPDQRSGLLQMAASSADHARDICMMYASTARPPTRVAARMPVLVESDEERVPEKVDPFAAFDPVESE